MKSVYVVLCLVILLLAGCSHNSHEYYDPWGNHFPPTIQSKKGDTLCTIHQTKIVYIDAYWTPGSEPNYPQWYYQYLGLFPNYMSNIYFRTKTNDSQEKEVVPYCEMCQKGMEYAMYREELNRKYYEMLSTKDDYKSWGNYFPRTFESEVGEKFCTIHKTKLVHIDAYFTPAPAPQFTNMYYDYFNLYPNHNVVKYAPNMYSLDRRHPSQEKVVVSYCEKCDKGMEYASYREELNRNHWGSN